MQRSALTEGKYAAWRCGECGLVFTKRAALRSAALEMLPASPCQDLQTNGASYNIFDLYSEALRQWQPHVAVQGAATSIKCHASHTPNVLSLF
jgi:hypothetical protein